MHLPCPALLLLLAAAALAACDAETAHPPAKDIAREVACLAADGAVRAAGTVTNHSSKPSTYVIDIEFTVDGFEVDTRTAIVEDVDPGDSVDFAVESDEVPAGDHACVVGDVERFRA